MKVARRRDGGVSRPSDRGGYPISVRCGKRILGILGADKDPRGSTIVICGGSQRRQRPRRHRRGCYVAVDFVTVDFDILFYYQLYLSRSAMQLEHCRFFIINHDHFLTLILRIIAPL